MRKISSSSNPHFSTHPEDFILLNHFLRCNQIRPKHNFWLRWILVHARNVSHDTTALKLVAFNWHNCIEWITVKALISHCIAKEKYIILLAETKEKKKLEKYWMWSIVRWHRRVRIKSIEWHNRCSPKIKTKYISIEFRCLRPTCCSVRIIMINKTDIVGAVRKWKF